MTEQRDWQDTTIVDTTFALELQAFVQNTLFSSNTADLFCRQ